jgi:hypothetical protein
MGRSHVSAERDSYGPVAGFIFAMVALTILLLV